MRLFIIFIFFTISIYAKDLQVTQNETSINQERISSENFDEDFNNEFSDEFETQKEIYDPFSGYNRAMTSFNDYFYINILNPVAKGYAYVLPQPVRTGIDNVFDNLFYPIRLANNLLQLKMKNSVEETARFVINSTVGILGIFDVASELGLQAHDEDFGQTLGFYGVGPGPHLVLPILGPSNLRDTFSMVGDVYLDPTTSNLYALHKHIANDIWAAALVKTIYMTNKASLHLGEYENLKKDAIDLYPFLRDVYEQKRLKEIEE